MRRCGSAVTTSFIRLALDEPTKENLGSIRWKIKQRSGHSRRRLLRVEEAEEPEQARSGLVSSV